MGGVKRMFDRACFGPQGFKIKKNSETNFFKAFFGWIVNTVVILQKNIARNWFL